ncbi:MAG: hypothetical protein ABH879_00040 [archaeon]
MAKESFISQQDFEDYVRKLPERESCLFLTGIELSLCTNEGYPCPYMGKDTFSLKSGVKKECRRPNILRLKKILGH